MMSHSTIWDRLKWRHNAQSSDILWHQDSVFAFHFCIHYPKFHLENFFWHFFYQLQENLHKLDPVGSTMRYEFMKLFTGSFYYRTAMNGCYLVVLSQYQAVPDMNVVKQITQHDQNFIANITLRRGGIWNISVVFESWISNPTSPHAAWCLLLTQLHQKFEWVFKIFSEF